MRVLTFMRKINLPLVVGICIALLLTTVSLYPEYYATSDPYAKETLQYDQDGSKFLTPPVEPGVDYIWGTDEKGRDLRSLIIYGCRATMMMALSVALGRLLVALPLAIAAGYKNRFAIWIINIFNVTFSAFPLIMVILLLSKVQLFADLFTNPMSIATVIMTAFGWSKLAKLLSKSVEGVLNEDFIEGEIAIGKTKLDIALQNVIPHIIPSMTVYFFLEVGVVLLLLSQVGVLGLILSTGYINENSGNLNVPYEFDWASLLVFAHELFGSYKNWLITYPALAFATSIIGFNLLGEGVRIEFEKRDSRIISVIKRLPGHLSPFKLFYELKEFKKHKKSIYIKLSSLLMILLLVFFPQPQSERQFNSLEAFAPIQEFGSSPFKYREYKVGRNVIAMNYIVDKLEEYGIQPFDNKYVHEMAVEEIPQVEDAIVGTHTEKQEQQFIYKQDFIMGEPIAVDGSYELVKLDLEKLKDKDWLYSVADSYSEKVLLLDVRNMEYNVFNSMLTDMRYFIKPKGVIFIESWNSTEGRGNQTVLVRDMGGIFSILMASDKGDLLLSQENMILDIKVHVQILWNVLNANVIGIIPGKDEVLKNDIIIVGSSINHIIDSVGKGTHEALKTGGIATQLQLAKMLAGEEMKPDRTIIFAFWDESLKYSQGAKIFSDTYIDRSKNDVFYIDIGKLDGDKLIIDSSGIKPKNKKGQSYVRHLKASLKNNDIDAVFRSINGSAISTFTSSKQEVLAFSSANQRYVIETTKGLKTAQVTRKDLVRFHKIGQMIVDTIFEIIYDPR